MSHLLLGGCLATCVLEVELGGGLGGECLDIQCIKSHLTCSSSVKMAPSCSVIPAVLQLGDPLFFSPENKSLSFCLNGREDLQTSSSLSILNLSCC